MNTFTIRRKLTQLLHLLDKPALRPQASRAYEQDFGDPTEEIASYQDPLPAETSHAEDADPEGFERDYQWFFA